MPTKRIIPGLLLRGGRLVKGVRFDDHRDAGNPKTTARAYNAQGADEIMLLDIDASREGRPPALDVIADVAKEMEIVHAKLDAIRSTLDSINQRLATLERVATGGNQQQKRYQW